MASNDLPPVTIGDQEDHIQRLAMGIGAAFAGDALNRAVILYLDSLSNDAEITAERRAQYYLPSIRNQVKNGALLIEAGDWAAFALWNPPGIKRQLPDPSSLSPPAREYFEKLSSVKKRHLGDRQYWYLHMIGRHPDRNEKGAIRALLEPYIQQAQNEGFPVWLDATNEHARDVYAHFGFRVAEKVIIGEGKIDRRGNWVPGGEGIVIYGMIKEK